MWHPLYPSITVTLTGDDAVALTVQAMHAAGLERSRIDVFLAEVQEADDVMAVVRRWVEDETAAPTPKG